MGGSLLSIHTFLNPSTTLLSTLLTPVQVPYNSLSTQCLLPDLLKKPTVKSRLLPSFCVNQLLFHFLQHPVFWNLIFLAPQLLDFWTLNPSVPNWNNPFLHSHGPKEVRRETRIKSWGDYFQHSKASLPDLEEGILYLEKTSIPLLPFYAISWSLENITSAFQAHKFWCVSSFTLCSSFGPLESLVSVLQKGDLKTPVINKSRTWTSFERWNAPWVITQCHW